MWTKTTVEHHESFQGVLDSTLQDFKGLEGYAQGPRPVRGVTSTQGKNEQALIRDHRVPEALPEVAKERRAGAVPYELVTHDSQDVATAG